MADYSNISKYFGASQADVAKFILLNADVKRTPVTPASSGGPSVMSRIFDILSRPNYAVAHFLKGVGRGEPDVRDIISGLAGTQKTTFSDVLKGAGVSNAPGRAILGLGLDIALDPTTYLSGAGFVKALGKQATQLPELSQVQKLLAKGEPISPELFGLPSKKTGELPKAFQKPIPPVEFSRILGPEKGFTTPQFQLDLPGVQPKILLPKIKSKTTIGVPSKEKPPVGQKSFVFPKDELIQTDQLLFDLPGVSQKILDLPVYKDLPRAEKIVEKIAEGDSEAVAKIIPQPKVEFEPRHQKLADEILSRYDPSRAKAQINQKFPDTLNAKQQVGLYYRSIEAARKIGKKPEWIASHAHKIYLAIEKSLQERGFVSRISSGENVSLGDVIQQMGGSSKAKLALDDFAKDIDEKSPIWKAIQGLRASKAIDESKSVKFIADKAAEARATVVASNTLSDGGIKEFEKYLKSLIKKTANSVEMSPAAISTSEKLTDIIFKQGKSPAQVVIEQKSKLLDDIVANGKANPEVNTAITRVLESDLGRLPRWAVDNNNSVEFLMGRVATWWGQKDLRPMSLNAIGAASATAAARGKALHKLFEGYDISQRSEALRLAQGFGVPSTQQNAQLADQIKRMLDNLVGQVSGNSVVLRSGVHINILNKWMRSYKVGFEFTKDKVKSLTGETVDYSKGTDWLNSWKTAEITEDPEIFLFKLQQAMEQATREKALFDEIGERFGVKYPSKGYRTRLEGYPYLEGYLFTDDIAKQLPRVIKDWTNPVNINSGLLKHYDRVLSMWKSGVTIYRPAHHIRNLIGDIYLGWMDGVNSLRPYILATKVQRSMKDAYSTLNNVDQLVQLGVISRNHATPRVGQVLFINKSGVKFTAEQIGAVAHQKGLLEHTKSIEDIIDLGEQSKFKPFGGKVQAVARGASELESHNTRLAHFIDKIMKSRGSNLEEIFEQASRRARKWHPTGLDLTQFEKKVLRRIIPFYSWLRKSTPLLLEGLVMNPGKVVIPSKIYDAAQEASGIETPGRGDPFPVDQMFPEWIRAQGVGPISLPDGVLGSFSNQEPPGYVMAGMGLNPLSDLISQVQSPGRSTLSTLTPAIQIPLELATGNKLFTGEPISGPEARPGAMEEFIGENIPIWSAIQGVTGITPFGGETKKSMRSDQAGKEAFINWLTSAGIKGTGPYMRQARFEHLAPGQSQRKAGREAFLQYLRGQE